MDKQSMREPEMKRCAKPNRACLSALFCLFAACGSNTSATDGPLGESADLASADAASAGADLAVAADLAPPSEVFTGDATYYDADGTGACGFPATTQFLIAALNGQQYSKAVCGRCAAVTGPKGVVVVRIVDLCPGCSFGDLDLSMTAFMQISPLSAGRVGISWSFVDCL